MELPIIDHEYVIREGGTYRITWHSGGSSIVYLYDTDTPPRIPADIALVEKLTSDTALCHTEYEQLDLLGGTDAESTGTGSD